MNLKYYPILFFIFLFVSCSENKIEPEKAAVQNEYAVPPDQISKNIEVIFIDSSYTKAVLKAKRALIFKEKNQTLLDGGLRIDFYSKSSGERLSYLEADSANIDELTKNMIARGHVIVVSDSTNSKLVTDILQWDNTNQKLYSTEFVRITTPTETLQGHGFESDLNLNNYKIFKVSGERK